jgi:DNA-directed RNA polymerase subunit E'/Rpb7
LVSQTSSGAQIKPYAVCFLAAELKEDETPVEWNYLEEDKQLGTMKEHNVRFKIVRYKDDVYVKNEASVIYINEKKIGQGKRTVLRHNDRIAVFMLHFKGRKCCQHDAHKAHSY